MSPSGSIRSNNVDDDGDKNLRLPSSSSSWDTTSIAIEYEKRVEPLTVQFAEEMIHTIVVGSADNDGGDDATAKQQQQQQLIIPKQKLLDVGCGTGAVSLAALKLGLDVTATDASAAMVERTKQRVADYHEAAANESNNNDDHDDDLAQPSTSSSSSSLSFSSAVADGQALPQEWTSTFDLAVANFSVIFFPSVGAGLREMVRCTKSNGQGRVAFTAWGDASQTPAFRVFPDVAAQLVPDLLATAGRPRRITGSVPALTNLMKDAGLVNVQIVGPVAKTLRVASPLEYYNRFARTSPPTMAMIDRMDEPMRIEFRRRVMELVEARGGQPDGSVALDSSAYIAYGTKPA